MAGRDEFDELIKKFGTPGENGQKRPGSENVSFRSGSSDDKFDKLPLFQEEIPQKAQPRQKKENFRLNITDREYYSIPDVPSSARRPVQPSSGGSGTTPPNPPRPGMTRQPGSGPQNAGPQSKAAKIKKRYQSLGRTAKVLIYIGCVLGISLFLSYFMLQGANDLFGFNKQDTQIEIVVPEGSSVSDVARLLKKNNVISEPTIFTIYAQSRNDSETKLTFQPGTYVLNPKMSYDELIITLSTGLSDDSVVRISFPEGMTAREIADELEKQKVCKADTFINALNTHDFSRYAFIADIPASATRYLKLEGYIFPDTYDFYTGENVDSVISKFLRAFDAQWTNEIKVQAEKMGMTTDEVITLASIIQKESGKVEEMNRVSGVFHNRLNDSETFPSLESDVTIFYVESDIKPYLNVADQTMYDSYNTYVCKGLPAGPICNPGVEAIKAAIYPEKNDYYFFLTDSEGTYYYAVTLAEHEKNDAAASKVGDGKTHGLATQ